MASKKYSQEEKEKLLKFRENLADLDLLPYQLKDEFLIKWLRARSLDLVLAEKMLRDSIKWRKEFKADTILEEQLPHELTISEPLAYCGISKDGFIVNIHPFGRYNSRCVIEKYGPDMMERFHVQKVEIVAKIMQKVSENTQVPVTQTLELFDMEGYSFWQFCSKACIQYYVRLAPKMESNYPEMMHYVMIINAPRFFNVMFSVVKPFMSKATLDKIQVFGCDKEKWKKALRERFPVENIPPYWGGTLEGVDAYCSDSDIWIRSPKPKELKQMMEGTYKVVQ
ncbi:SEC14-like protein 4 [Folsomia candida]|uniref:Phosphatidylinositol/phosphatidylcholine transfer protein SFH1 n=1 Tax=Folsomia candida TaxID=158441 RepID=A0A226F5T0_FOLCA|nr:SEC14-like protein 4 [Folsomia candida]OXA65142.1 Phosphatidylinositol/phosphatidylcholine transfer protein SFH1 [Folsomia candida]